MILSRLGWACWALIPVIGVTYHFGPGQAAAMRDRAARLQTEAVDAERLAADAQSRAYDAHLAAIEARRAAFLSKSPADEAKALEATKAEDLAYAGAAHAWREAANRIEAVTSVFGEADLPEGRQLRLAHGRALVRSGEVWAGIESLEGLLAEVDGEMAEGVSAAGDTALESKTREELATAYYYGARILRLNGMPAQEWMVESGKARQHFRYLAEDARGQHSQGQHPRHEDASGDRSLASRETTADAVAANYQRNLELVLNLEQSSLAELQAKPLPRDSPSKCQGTRPCSNCNKKGPNPPREKKDARGAGGAGNVPPGW